MTFLAVSRGEVILAIRRTRGDSTPGLYGIPAIVYKRCLMTAFAVVSQDFLGVCGAGPCASGLANRKGDYLAETRQERITRSPRSYRPISLLSVMGKFLEKIMCKRLIGYLESRQSCYRLISMVLDRVERQRMYIAGCQRP